MSRSAQKLQVLLNRFPIPHLNIQDFAVFQHSYAFQDPPRKGEEARALWKLIYALGQPAVPHQGNILSFSALSTENPAWTLGEGEPFHANLEDAQTRDTLESLLLKFIEKKLYRVPGMATERGAGSLILWDKRTAEVKGKSGLWELHKGAEFRVVLGPKGDVYLEVDRHYRLLSPKSLQEWWAVHGELEVQHLKNTYNNQGWVFEEVVEGMTPDQYLLETQGSLLDYHVKKGNGQGVALEDSTVILVKKSGAKQSTPHLAKLVRPAVTLDTLSALASWGDREAGQVTVRLREGIDARLKVGAKTTQRVAKWAFDLDIPLPRPVELPARELNGATLIAHGGKVIKKTEDALRLGCVRVGETRFGYVSLGADGHEMEVRNLIQQVGEAHGEDLHWERLPAYPWQNSLYEQKKWWAAVAETGIHTVLFIAMQRLKEKTQLRVLAAQAQVAVQFMVTPANRYKAANLALGLLSKAGWQTVGLLPSRHANAADLCIGFDAGRNARMSFGTSAFALLKNGQCLGWEIPEAQKAETLSGQMISQAVQNLVFTYEKETGSLPKRVLLLRDGFVRQEEFDLTLKELALMNVQVDVVEVIKSGGGRVAVQQNGSTRDAPMGTLVQFRDPNKALLVSSSAKAGGSARPLQLRKVCGDLPIELIAEQVYHLTRLHPASSMFSSRLPMPLHFADKMAKEVQRMDQVGILHGLDRKKLFFV